MKKIGFILLITILLLQIGGLFFIYKIEQGFVQYAMIEKLENKNSDFIKLTLSVSDFEKCKINSGEISFKGKMYDIKSIHISKNIAELTVINDSQEEKILEKIKELLIQSKPHNNRLPNKLIKLFSLVYISPVSDDEFIMQKEITKYQKFKIIFTSIIREISSLPPKFV